MNLSQSLQSDLVKHLKPKKPRVVPEDATIRETINIMQEHKVGCVVVRNASGQAVGVFTERDVLRRVVGEMISMDSPVKSAMSTELTAVRETDLAVTAIKLLHEKGFRHLPVLADSGEPCGVVSVKSVMEYLVAHCPRVVYCQPPRSSAVPEAREGA